MAKFRPAKVKPKGVHAPQGAIPCVVMVILGMVLVMVFMYFVMRGA